MSRGDIVVCKALGEGPSGTHRHETNSASIVDVGRGDGRGGRLPVGAAFRVVEARKAPDDTSAVARSAAPALPSAQSTPQAVTIAGLTPAAPPSSTNLAAASGSATAGATALAAPRAPPASIPVTSTSTLANAPATNPSAQDTLADRLVSTPSSKSTAPSPLAAVPNAAAVATAGPYDPNAYQPSASPVSTGLDGESSNSVDRYGVSSASPATAVPMVNAPQSLASAPAGRYGSPQPSTVSPTTPATTPLTDPAAVAADRYANSTLPVISGAYRSSSGDLLQVRAQRYR